MLVLAQDGISAHHATESEESDVPASCTVEGALAGANSEADYQAVKAPKLCISALGTRPQDDDSRHLHVLPALGWQIH